MNMNNNNLSKETLEERVERLEYYISLMRDYILDTEKFQFWDWAISKHLNNFEVREIINVTKNTNKKFKKGELPDFEEYCNQIKTILNWEKRPDYREQIDKSFIITMLNRLKSFMFRDLIGYFLKEN